MTDPELGELVRLLIATAKDKEAVAEVIDSMPNPFLDGGRLLAKLAFAAADAIEALSTELSSDYGPTPEEIRAKYFEGWAARDLGIN